ncbi:MAG: hypothetical protein JWO38_8313 [Gemmataceae bacterium]|nr:hypothetical protein [Gemmataceae bacterium]
MPASIVPGYGIGRRTGDGRGFPAWVRRLLTVDYFPATERVVKQLVWNPAGAMILAATVALLCGLFLSPHALVLAAGLLAVMAVGVVWPWVTIRGVSARFGFERSRCREGTAVGVTLTVSRATRWGAAGLAVRGGFEDHHDPHVPVPVVASLPPVAGRSAVEVAWTFTPPRRGTYPVSTPAPRLVTGYPFGLCEARTAVATPDPLIVWPKSFPVGAVPDVGGDHQIEGSVSRSKVGQSGDVIGVRPYRRGDSPRRVHWTQTARHDRLVVCELQSNARPRVQVVLDSDPANHRGVGPDSSREWAVRIAASLVEGWLAQGAEVEAVIDGRLYPTSAGTAHLRTILDALAQLADDRGPPLGDVLAAPVCRSFADGLQVVITTDCGLAALPVRAADPCRRFFVLEAAGFRPGPDPGAGGPTRPAVRPWVLVESPDRVRHALRYGWKEAAHGG